MAEVVWLESRGFCSAIMRSLICGKSCAEACMPNPNHGALSHPRAEKPCMSLGFLEAKCSEVCKVLSLIFTKEAGYKSGAAS